VRQLLHSQSGSAGNPVGSSCVGDDGEGEPRGAESIGDGDKLHDFVTVALICCAEDSAFETTVGTDGWTGVIYTYSSWVVALEAVTQRAGGCPR
jgi:hypothetical protein